MKKSFDIRQINNGFLVAISYKTADGSWVEDEYSFSKRAQVIKALKACFAEEEEVEPPKGEVNELRV